MAKKDYSTRPHSGDRCDAQLIGVIVLSLGLWIAIWDAFSSLVPTVFR